MTALTATMAKPRKVGVTKRPLEAELPEHAAILFAMRVADLANDVREVTQLTFGTEASGSIVLSRELRERTAVELDALASHDRKRQAIVLDRVFGDGRIDKLRGIAFASYSRKNGLRLQWIPELDDPRMMVDYGLALLLDDSQPWGGRFFRCHLPTCRRFFIAARPRNRGQFRYKYCCPEHQKLADASNVADRVKRFRQRQKELSK